jgi:hypothetical protein
MYKQYEQEPQFQLMMSLGGDALRPKLERGGDEREQCKKTKEPAKHERHHMQAIHHRFVRHIERNEVAHIDLMLCSQ